MRIKIAVVGNEQVYDSTSPIIGEYCSSGRLAKEILNLRTGVVKVQLRRRRKSGVITTLNNPPK